MKKFFFEVVLYNIIKIYYFSKYWIFKVTQKVKEITSMDNLTEEEKRAVIERLQESEYDNWLGI